MTRKTLTIATYCFNEEGNVREFYRRCKEVLAKLPEYDYEFIVADNCSTDGTQEVLREIAAEDPRFRVILNSRNFGHIRSPYNGFLQGEGDAVVGICLDLQEPPEMILDFVREWENGAEVVTAIHSRSRENPLMFLVRRFYYWLLTSLSEIPLIPNFTGFGLYDRKFMEAIRRYREPYPFFRGLVVEVGFKRVEVPFVRQARQAGKTKNNLFTLYDMAINGIVSHSKVPLRLAVFTGFVMAILSLMVSIGYLVYKLVYWDTFSLGLAPLVVGLFFFSAVQMVFIGLIGEYLGAVWTQVKDRPLVIEEERINFD